MKYNERPSLGGCAIVFALIHLFEYGIEHVVYLLRDAAWSGMISLDTGALGIISVTAEYAVDAIEIASVSLMALMLIISLSNRSILSTVLFGICMLLTKTVYIFPHYYMTFISYGYDSIETIVMIIPLLLFVILMTAVLLSLTVAIALLPAFKKARSNRSATLSVLGEDLSDRGFTNLGSASSAAIGIIALLSTAMHIVLAIIDTANAFVKYGAALPPSVILSIIGRLLFLLALIVILHFALCLVRNHIMKEDTEEESAEGASSELSRESTKNSVDGDIGHQSSEEAKASETDNEYPLTAREDEAVSRDTAGI